ncbi:unnamed protein product [Nesidiocoris tenuis]|uniref:Uncharacterized protein n=1 Tax=Nesidiocoris tenuis TaxID=355587 RepID=A0A6H5FZR1_9HEMI|nr:unnamed protein product [Nesidiocoris tenuis]
MVGILAWSVLTEINYAYFRTNLSSLEKIFFNVRSWTFFAARTFNMIVTLQYILLTGYLRQRLVRTRSALKRRPTAAMLEAGSVVDMCQSVVRCYGQQMLVLFADSTYALISWAYFFLTLNNRPDNSNYMKISEKVFLAVILLFQIGGPTSINEKANKSRHWRLEMAFDPESVLLRGQADMRSREYPIRDRLVGRVVPPDRQLGVHRRLYAFAFRRAFHVVQFGRKALIRGDKRYISIKHCRNWERARLASVEMQSVQHQHCLDKKSYRLVLSKKVTVRQVISRSAPPISSYSFAIVFHAVHPSEFTDSAISRITS